VIDMPLLDTRTDKTQLIGKFISDIVLQILSFVAQTEREFIKQRQAEGIKIAKEKGIKFGRPRIELPSSFDEISMLYEQKVITNNEASNLLNMSRGTFLKYHKKRLNEIILR
ncbi:MAG TPA: recombinase family protein, partial [Candidatus Onthovivens sp.]|nr:recombinase family protein [Candidatus Onthovivens sp.]